MAENKRYYWLKLNENFFEDDTMTWLEEQENGKEYIIFYLKLCLKSLSDDGHLVRYVGERLIPYDINALSRLTNTNKDTVSIAMKLFIEIGLINQMDSGEIYMTQINEMIGSETDSAKRMRKSRIQEESQKNTLASHCYTDVHKSDTEKELDLDIDIETENKEQSSSDDSSLSERFENLWKDYPNKKGKKKALSSYKTALKNGATDEQIKDGIERYKEHLKQNEWLNPAHGSSWFEQNRWNDEYDADSNNTEDHTSSLDEITEDDILGG